MDYRFEFTDKAEEDLKVLDDTIRQRVVKKLRFFALQENPLRFAEHLTNSPHGDYRFRVGDYRVMFDVSVRGVITILEILRIKHRSLAYKK